MATASASVEPSQLSVTPGTMSEAQLLIRNSGPAEDRFTLVVDGSAASWVSVTPFALVLAPGEQGTARLFVRPPRSAALLAGHHPVSIRIRPERDRKDELVVTAEVEVAAFADLSVALSPGEATGRSASTSHLRIDNRGNVVVRARVAGDVPDGEVTVTAVPPSVEVAPGAGAAVRIETRQRRRVFGPAPDSQFTVVVAPEAGDPIRVAGSTAPGRGVSGPLRIGVALIALVLVGVGVRGILSPSSHGGATRIAAPAANCPGAGHLAHDANGQIRHNVLQPDNFSFLFLQSDNCLPVRWNPCAQIHYVVNGAQATPAQLDDTRQAVADAAQATGIDFVFDDTTTEDPNARQPFEPSLYPGRWAPVLIDWRHEGGANDLTEVAGGGFPVDARGVDVSGEMFLNLDAHLAGNAPIPTGFGPGVTWGRILLHELGHVLGLGHVTSFDEIMHEPVTDQTSPTSAYGFGDLAGLRLLGRSAGCLTTPPVPAA
jgi:hypothetical protein